MTPERLAAAEIAKTVGITIRAVHKRAKAEKWKSKTLGNRKEYYFNDFPPGWKVKIIQARESSYIKGMILPQRADLDLSLARELLKKFENAPGWSKRKAEARGEVVEAFAHFAKSSKKGLTKAKKEFVKRFNAGNDGLGISDQTYLIIDKLSRGTLDRWRADHKTLGLVGLLESCRNRKKFGGLTEEMKQYIIGIKTNRIHTRPARICEYLENKFSNHDLPSDATVRRFIQSWETENESLVAYLTNPDKWRSEYQVAFGDSSEKAKFFLHMLEFDNTPADVMCANGKRYTITGAIDIFSRKAKCLVVPTSKSQAVANLMRWTILNWGLFDVAIADNGKDYASKHIEAACGALGIDLHFLPPFTPEGKPHIERFFGTLAVMLFEELQGYIGHSVADRQAIRNRRSFAQRMFNKKEIIECRLMPGELQEVIDTWMDRVYHQRPHSSIGKSPEARAGESTQPVRKILDERVLDILLAPSGKPTVLKKGIKFENGYYAAVELADDWVGKKVQIRRDLADAGTLYVFDLDFNFICIAKDTSLDGISVEDVNIARKRQRKHITAQVRALKTLAKEVGDPMAELLEAKRGEKGKVFGFRREEAFESDAIREAAKAVESPADAFEEFTADEDPPAKDKVVQFREEPIFQTGLERYKYLDQQSKIRILTEKEQGWIDGYKCTEEYYRIFVMPYE